MGLQAGQPLLSSPGRPLTFLCTARADRLALGPSHQPKLISLPRGWFRVSSRQGAGLSKDKTQDSPHRGGAFPADPGSGNRG